MTLVRYKYTLKYYFLSFTIRAISDKEKNKQNITFIIVSIDQPKTKIIQLMCPQYLWDEGKFSIFARLL